MEPMVYVKTYIFNPFLPTIFGAIKLWPPVIAVLRDSVPRILPYSQ